MNYPPLEELIKTVEEELRVYSETIQPTSFSCTYNDARGIATATINIRPLDSNDSASLSNVFFSLEQKIKTTVLSLDNSLNEVIMHNTTGEIFDQGTKYYSIRKGLVFEIYLYEASAHLFLRLTHEEPTQFEQRKPELSRQTTTLRSLIEREWISVDIDYISQSPWLKE